MIIYDKTGKKIIDAPVTKQAKRVWQLMSSNNVQLSFELSEYINIPKGSYINYLGSKFYMIRSFTPDDLSSKDGYKYEPIFDAPEYWLQTRNIFYLGQGFKEAIFTNTTNIIGFSEIIIVCANEHFSNFNWSFSIHSDVDAIVAKTIAFSGETIFDACTAIAEAWETEWWAETNSNKIIIHFGKLQVGNNLAIRANEIVKSFPARRGDDANFGTRFYVFGSTRNLTSDYGQAEQGGATNHISELRLRLPDGQNHIDAQEDLSDEDVVEKLVFFDDVYPKNTDKITKVSTVQRPVDDSDDTFTAYIVEASASPFKEADIIDGETIMIKFTSGVLNGFEFEVDKTSDFKNNKFEIMATHVDDGNGGVISTPGGVLIPKIDDTFILTGVKLPTERIAEAEQELLEAGKAYAAKNSGDTTLYECSTNPVYCEANEIDLTMGQAVVLHHIRFGTKGRQSRLQGFEKLLWNPYIATYQFGDNTAYSRFGEIKNEIEGVTYNNRLGVGSNIAGVYIIGQNDTTTPTDFNVNSAKRADYKYLNRQTGGVVKGDLAVVGDIESKRKAIADTFQNSTFTAGQFGSGFQLKQNSNGQSYLEIDNILVRREMQVNKLTIAEIKSVGGSILLSLADMVAMSVIEQANSYRVFFNNDNGKIANKFAINDQAICRTWNGSGAKYYWRLVVGIGANYIDLSKTDKDGSSIPNAGDEIIQFGNRTDVKRQQAIILSAYGSDAPSMKQYGGVNSYKLTGKEKTVISPEGNKFTGNFIIESSGKTIVEELAQLNGEFAQYKSETTTKFEQTENKITLGVSESKAYTNNAVNAIEVGGVNLLDGTRDFSGWSWNNAPTTMPDAYKGLFSYKKVGNYGSRICSFINLEAGTYTVSCYAKYIDGAKNYTIVFLNGNTYSWWLYFPSGAVAGQWYRLSRVLSIGVSIYNLRIEESSPYIGVEIAGIKLEKGNKATDWSPSPADVQSSIDNVRTETQAKIDVLSDNITLSVNESKTYADNAVNAIEVGGVNLINNSTSRTIGSSSSSYNLIVIATIEYAGIYTFSVEKATALAGSYSGYSTRFYSYSKSRIFSNKTLAIGSTKQSHTFEVTQAILDNFGTISILIYAGIAGSTSGKSIRIERYQLEKGNKATDWSPSPTDVQRNIDGVQSSLDVFKTETNSQFTVQTNQIAAKVSQTDFNSLGNRVASAESSIVQNANKITLGVSESKAYTNNAVNAIEVGGVNLVNNTSSENKTVHNQTGWWYQIQSLSLASLGLKSGDVLTCSAFIDSWTHATNSCSLRINFNNNNLNTKLGTSVSPPGGRSVATFTIPNSVSSMQLCLATTYNPSIKTSAIYRQLKLEKGNKATDWSPSPADVQSSIDNVRTETQAKIDVLSDNITLQVEKTTNVAARKVRYIRDWLNGSNANTGNHWVEIQAYKDSINVAKGKNCTMITNWHRITDDSITSGYAETGGGLRGVTVDLGATQEIDHVKVWHYFGDGRTYKDTKTEVSADGKNWFTLFDSGIEGTYKETSAGRTYYVNDYAQQANREKDLVSSLSIDANKISLASKTIELNGTTIAKAIEAETLSVGGGRFQVAKDGTLTAIDGKFQGKVEATILEARGSYIQGYKNISMSGGGIINIGSNCYLNIVMAGLSPVRLPKPSDYNGYNISIRNGQFGGIIFLCTFSGTKIMDLKAGQIAEFKIVGGNVYLTGLYSPL